MKTLLLKRLIKITLTAVLLIKSTIFADTSNTILKSNFNFGHQSGWMYSRMGDAYFKESGSWDFQTGFMAYYTSKMPMVKNPDWKKRTMLAVPLYFIIYPCNSIALEVELTDLFVEFPYKNKHNMGGKTPRFKTKIRLLKEGTYKPALSFTVGVAFSSAKPFTIWDNNHNYDESNGLAGAGTGEADYILLFNISKKIGPTLTIHSRFGLIPVGSPVEYTRGSGQADEIPYGISIYNKFNQSWSAQLEVSGMYNGLSSTTLAHYSVLRAQIHRETKFSTLTVNLEKGLTRESDEFVAGFYNTFHFKKKKK